MGIKAEDIIADHENYAVLNGIRIRKGTMGAALANAEIFTSSDSTETEKNDAMNSLKELAPLLVNLSFCKHLTWKNPEIQKIFDEANNK